MTPPAPAPASSPVPPPSPLAGSTPRATRAALFAAWLALVLWLAAHHVFWRDEVRAFTLALSGDGVAGMLRAVHGEGHPALWYLALRLAHDLVPVREVLPAAALVFGTATAALIAARAPFRPLVLALVLFGGWLAHEYSVMARNYGIAALLIVVVADRLARGSRNGWTIGLLLALLCNTNVPAVLIAAGFLLFWLVELVADGGWRPTAAWRPWGIAVALALAGVVACFLEVYPPVNDAATAASVGHFVAPGPLKSLTDLAATMLGLMPEWSWPMPAASLLLLVLLAACPLSLLRSPAGFVAAAAVLPALILFFVTVYPGSYRHEAQYLVFVLALHWMVAKGRGGRWPARAALPRGRLADTAGDGLLLLLAIQLLILVPVVQNTARGEVASRSRDLGALLHRPDLADAIVVGEPDTIVEALPYYAGNPTWLVREHRFGSVSRFTSDETLDLTLGDVLAAARALQRRTGRPVVIAMGPRLGSATAAMTYPEGYRGSFAMTRPQIAAFLAATKRLARFGPTTAGESYDVYLLRPPVTAS